MEARLLQTQENSHSRYKLTFMNDCVEIYKIQNKLSIIVSLIIFNSLSKILGEKLQPGRGIEKGNPGVCNIIEVF